MSEPNVKGCSLNPVAFSLINKALSPNQNCQSGGVSFLTPATQTMMRKLTTSIDSKVTKYSFPSLDVVKFSGNSCGYFRFKSCFDQMDDSQNISEAQEMTPLLQFLDDPDRSAVAGFEEVPG